jgi:hypothetical protein
MKNLIFVSVAFGPLYIEQQDRLKESILNIYPDANLLFFRDKLPEKSKPFLDSLYGFKVHAIKEAIEKGFTKIIWLDPAMILCREFDTNTWPPIVAVKDENKLSAYISDKMLGYFRCTRDILNANSVHLVGGSLYYFDFSEVAAGIIFDEWFHLEKDGYFGSQHQEASEQLQGHRADESSMAMALYSHQILPVSPASVGYCVGENPIFFKKQFK